VSIWGKRKQPESTTISSATETTRPKIFLLIDFPAHPVGCRKTPPFEM
jgi:hypothetical protein